MSAKVLFVDDESNVLEGIQRQLRKKFEVTTAVGPEEGLGAIDAGSFAVVVSDMRMPSMNGAQFLAKVGERSPDTVRMILSGQSDLDAAIQAINDGSVFRFLTKPCDTETLTRGLNLALEQYRLVVAEKELLDRTLSGAVKAMTEILSLANPEAFSRASRIQESVEAVAKALGVEDPWEFRIAALLSQLGCVTLPSETVAKVNQGKALSDLEERMFAEHPKVAGQLLASIPRLGRVARMVTQQMMVVDVSSLPADPLAWEVDQLGAQTLRVVSEFDRLMTRGIPRAKALASLRSAESGLPTALVDALDQLEASSVERVSKTVKVAALSPGMVFKQDVKAASGVLLARDGQEVTDSMISRLRNFAVGVGVVEPIQVSALE